MPIVFDFVRDGLNIEKNIFENKSGNRLIYIVMHYRKKFLWEEMQLIKAASEEGRTTMTDKVIENNQVMIMGTIVSGFSFSHEIFGEGFYMVEVRVSRLSDSADIIPFMVSERLLDVTEDYSG